MLKFILLLSSVKHSPIRLTRARENIRMIRRYDFFDIITDMIITKSEPFTKNEIEKLKKQFDVYIKTVIDVKMKVCSGGADRHFESEKILLEKGSEQSNLWGGGIDLETKLIDSNSFVNIRPSDNNTSNEIQSTEIRSIFEDLTKYFFKEIYG